KMILDIVINHPLDLYYVLMDVLYITYSDCLLIDDRTPSITIITINEAIAKPSACVKLNGSSAMLDSTYANALPIKIAHIIVIINLMFPPHFTMHNIM